MEWGNFLAVISALYLAWYGLNFLYDLFIGGKPKVATHSGIHYNIKGLVDEEEPARIVTEQNFEEKPVDVHKTSSPLPKAPAADTPTATSRTQNIETTPNSEPLPLAADDSDDWASVIDKENQPEETMQEEKIEIPVQGQPVAVNDFIAALKEQAKSEASAISF